MRTIDEIKANIEIVNSANAILGYPTDGTLITELRNELCLALTADIPLDRLEQICQAEKDGRCEVLPCKVGTPIWWIDVSIEPNDHGKWITRKRIKSGIFDYSVLDWIDTLFYLTRESALKALEEQK